MTTDSSKSSFPSRLLYGLIAIDIALVALYLLNYFVPGPSGTLRRLLDIDGEDSIGTWYSSAKLLFIAALFTLFCCRNVTRHFPASWPLLFFPAIFALFSLDEIVQIHEWLGRKTDAFLPTGAREDTVFHVTGIWMFAIGIPVLIAFFFFVRASRRFLHSAPGFTFRFLTGIVVFMAGAVGVETLTNFVPDPESLGFRLQVCAEEGLEMIGATLILGAAATLLRAHGFAIELQPVLADDRS